MDVWLKSKLIRTFRKLKFRVLRSEKQKIQFLLIVNLALFLLVSCSNAIPKITSLTSVGSNKISLSNLPPSPSNALALRIFVNGSRIQSYRYKLGEESRTDCSQEEGYGSDLSVMVPIENNVSSFTDSSLKLCVIGKNNQGVSQSFSDATSFVWVKDTLSPNGFNILGVRGINDTLLDLFFTSSNGFPQIVWDASLGADSYDVTLYESDASVVVCATENIPAPVNHHSLTSCSSSLKNGNFYWISVVAKDNAGNATAALNNLAQFKVNTTVSSLHSSITGTGPVVADQVNFSTVSIVLKNSDNIPIENVIPTFTATDTNATNTYGACSASGASGISTCLLKSTKAENKEISLTSPASLQGGEVSFIAGPPTQLAFHVQPSDALVNTPLLPAVEVQVQDAYGNIANATSEMVNIMLDSSSPSLNLGGSLSKMAVNGIATFSDLIIYNIGIGYKLKAMVSGLITETISSPFNVNPSTVPTHFTDSLVWSASLSHSPDLRWNHPDMDSESIDSYEVAIGTSPGLQDIQGWTGVGKNNHAKLAHLSLTPNTTYYASLRALITGGLYSSTVVSDGWTTDVLPPSLASGFVLGSIPSTNTETPTLSWSFNDFQSGFGSAKARVIQASDHSPVSDWFDIYGGENISGVVLKKTTNYYMKVVASDQAGNETELLDSPEWVTSSTSEDFTVALGINDSAQLNTSFLRLLKPDLSLPVHGEHSFAQIYSGMDHACGLTLSGLAYCWGNNSYGQLGDSTAINKLIPTPVSGAFVFTHLALGRFYTCGITASGQAYCWGENAGGKLGDGTLMDRFTPTLVSGGILFSQLSAKNNHTCGIALIGQLYCWGENLYGQLGDGTTLNRPNPVLISMGFSFLQVATGKQHTCSLTTTGVVHCWGSNNYGQLGDGTTNSRTIPSIIMPGNFFAQIAVGDFHTCGIMMNQSVYCWGHNSYGQLGDSTNSNRTIPNLVLGSHSFSRISLGSYNTCGATLTGRYYCWGLNSSGELGDGTIVNKSYPTMISDKFIFSQIATGGSFTCGLTSLGGAYCWGNNFYGQLGNRKIFPRLVTNGSYFTEVAAGQRHSCGIKASGMAYCWGINTQGQLGDGSTVSKNSPTLVSGSLSFTHIAVGETHTCGITTNGTMYCWGYLENGLGDSGLTSQSTVPLIVEDEGIPFIKVTLGRLHTCGIKTTGSAYCWGSNSFGKIGDGTTTNRSLPTMVTGVMNFNNIAAGANHTCGIAVSGIAYCWGYGGLYGLGDSGMTIDSSSPIEIAGGLSFLQIVVGANHTCAVSVDSFIYCWGYNNYGQLGDGSSIGRGVPSLIGGGISFSQISAGNYHTCGVTLSGAAYCWGLNDRGQLGDLTFTNQSAPVPVAGNYFFNRISSGGTLTLGIISSSP